MITVIFRSRYSRPIEVKMYLVNGHAWHDGMTFCIKDRCNCGWPKVEVKDGD